MSKARKPTPPSPPDSGSLLALLAANVKSRRTELNLTVKELSARCGLSERFVGLVEAGEGNPAITRLHALAHALGCSISELLGDAGHAPALPTAAREMIALLGLRGAGKTTVGKLLAKKLRVPFVELDQRVEAEAGLTLGEIFAIHGEDYYRRLEVTALQKLQDEGARCVVATGGGIVTNRDAMAFLSRVSRTIWLRAPVTAHWARVIAQGDRRPMANNPHARAELDSIYAQRAPLYARADIVVDTGALEVDGVVSLVGRKLGRDFDAALASVAF